MSRKPLVSTSQWVLIYESPEFVPFGSKSPHAKVYKDTNPDNWAFYKVTSPDTRPKYFYGESAWSDVQRYVVDLGDFGGWDIFH